MTPVGWILEIQKKERERMITSKDINDELEHLNILNQLVSYEELDKLLLLDNLSSSTKFKINDIKNKKMKS